MEVWAKWSWDPANWKVDRKNIYYGIHGLWPSGSGYAGQVIKLADLVAGFLHATRVPAQLQPTLWNDSVRLPKSTWSCPTGRRAQSLNVWCSIRYIPTLWLTCWKNVRHSFSNPTTGNRRHDTATASSCSECYSHSAYLARAWMQPALKSYECI